MIYSIIYTSIRPLSLSLYIYIYMYILWLPQRAIVTKSVASQANFTQCHMWKTKRLSLVFTLNPCIPIDPLKTAADPHTEFIRIVCSLPRKDLCIINQQLFSVLRQAVPVLDKQTRLQMLQTCSCGKVAKSEEKSCFRSSRFKMEKLILYISNTLQPL